MEQVLFAGYLIFFSWLVTRVGFFRNTGLRPSVLVLLFLLKVLSGIIYGWIGIYYGDLANMVDSWGYHAESLYRCEELKQDPLQFFGSLFQTDYSEGYSNFFSSKGSWWNDVKGNSLIKLFSVFNLFSDGNYYTNVIFYAFITLWGPVAFYHVIRHAVKADRFRLVAIAFLLPSFMYWTSGLHKEGLLFNALASIIYIIYFGWFEKKLGWKRGLILLISLVTIMLFRNFLIVPLLPAVLAWLLCLKTKKNPATIFVAVYGVAILLFFTARYISPSLDLPAAVAAKQTEYMNLKGNSNVAVEPLEPSFQGFLERIPHALSMGLLRPYPLDVKQSFTLLAFLEISVLIALTVLFLWQKARSPLANSPLLCFLLFFGFSVALMSGLVVNNLGAMVRYRSIILPFLTLPVIAGLRLPRQLRMLELKF